MLVYGDRPRKADPRDLIAGLEQALARAPYAGPGIERHAQLVAAFIDAGALLQGLADEAFASGGGCDELSAGQQAAMNLQMSLARQVAASWRSGFAIAGLSAMPELHQLAWEPMPDAVTVKTPEGYAFYTVYPEAYLEAASRVAWPRAPQVIGLRSIGASLAAMVAVGAGAGAPITLRPDGHPSRRTLSLGDRLRARLLAEAGAPYAVVDEGPGLSGSSFAAVGELLAGAGVPPSRIHYFPSHPGAPGPAASQACRERWATAQKTVVDFDALVGTKGLARWFADLAGAPVAPIEDLSAGRWADRSAVRPPTHPRQERRKFLLHTATGSWLLKFAGLGRIGEQKLARARALHEAGLTPRPLGLRHGFLIEAWRQDARPPHAVDRGEMIDHLGRYLGFRARLPARPEEGASVADLTLMAGANIAEITGACPTIAPPDERRVRRVHTDNRLHAWEWLALEDGRRLLKCDALDHDDAHDLIGCQDIAWDVAGAAVEFDLSDTELAQLRHRLDRPIDDALLGFYRLCYPAFQSGLWAGTEASAAVVTLRENYREHLVRALKSSTCVT